MYQNKCHDVTLLFMYTTILYTWTGQPKAHGNEEKIQKKLKHRPFGTHLTPVNCVVCLPTEILFYVDLVHVQFTKFSLQGPATQSVKKYGHNFSFGVGTLAGH